MTSVSPEEATKLRSNLMYVTPWCGDCRRAKQWFDAHGSSYEAINREHDDQAAPFVMQINGGMRSVPTIVFLMDRCWLSQDLVSSQPSASPKQGQRRKERKRTP